MNLPKEKQNLLDSITGDLQCVPGVKAIVLGGSYAIGMASDHSDLDIGIYYSEQNPFDLEQIKTLAEKYADSEAPTVTRFYEWGPWVNGGAWIKSANGKIDFLYKNIEQISKTIENAQKGIWENHFEQQPPYGFSSIIFLAETQYCIPLYDPEGIIAKLKKNVAEYPKNLKQAVIQQSLWSAEFTIWQAAAFAEKADIYNTLGCLTRAVKNIITTLFAINERYPLGDKRAIDILEQSKIKPANMARKISSVLCTDKDNLIQSVSALKDLFQETVALAQGEYNPYYKL